MGASFKSSTASRTCENPILFLEDSQTVCTPSPSFLFVYVLFIDERERNINLFSTYLCLHCLILVCALNGDRAHNLGVLGQCSNQLSYPVRAPSSLLKEIFFLLKILELQIFYSVSSPPPHMHRCTLCQRNSFQWL